MLQSERDPREQQGMELTVQSVEQHLEIFSRLCFGKDFIALDQIFFLFGFVFLRFLHLRDEGVKIYLAVIPDVILETSLTLL